LSINPKKTMLTNKRATFQAIFWGGYIVVSLLIFAQYLAKASGIVLIMVLVGSGLYGASELLRNILLKHGRLASPGWPLLACMLVLVPLAATLVQCGIFLIVKTALSFNWVTLPGGNADYRLGSVLGYIFNSAIMLWLWCGIWLSAYYLRRYRQAEIETWRAQAAQSKLELDVLKGQINPHFTFNALNNLRAMINEDTDKARTMVTQLSNILRYTLHHSQHDRVSLKDELAIVRDYIALEQLHYENCLDVQWQIDADLAANITLPPMLLQLLVENAVKHGIAKRVGGGTVAIGIHFENQLLTINVRNPGNWAPNTETGIGWNNLRERLVRVGGAGATCTIQDANNTVIVTVTVPQ
jgi:Histidine kinase